MLLRELRKVGADGQVTALLDRDPAAHTSLDNPSAVAELLDLLHQAGADGQVAMERDPAAHAGLDNPSGVAELLAVLREAGAAGQAAALASRAAAHASLNDPRGVVTLLRELSEAGAAGQAAALIERLPAVGQFELFCSHEGHAEQFRFGREADGRPAKPWGWTDLG
jgi:hypothetical protein